MKYYRDTENNYIGGYEDSPPADAVEVPFPPDHFRQKWDGSGWLPLVLTQEEEDAEEIRNDAAIQALLNKRPSEIDDHIRPMTLPELKEAFLLLVKQVKLLTDHIP